MGMNFFIASSLLWLLFGSGVVFRTEEARRTNEEENQEGVQHHDGRQRAGHPQSANGFDDPDQQATDYCTRDASQASKQNRHKGLYGEDIPDARMNVVEGDKRNAGWLFQ